ncbi:tRNA-dependent cyclodipeptide synthase [Streptomyces sp. NPDC008313]|uniref:tRNA-dependent cyclodipeptide synthase n=1 Tax=Streptomyces sp. NPDC008313 TaxID=3364826 RepID=UPI0036ED05DA
MFEFEPLTERCGGLLPTACHVCIGVSPFNSYFSTPRLRRMADWALTRFGNVHFFVPDALAACTLEALGYEPDHARRKARRQGQYVHNKIATALSALGVENPRRLILGMDRLYATPRYVTLLDDAYRCFREDEEFRAACLDATHWVLEQKLAPGTTASQEQLRGAVRYFLGELPLFADAGGIAASIAGVPGVPGVPSTPGVPDVGGHSPSFFVYHQRVGFLERFFARELAWRPVEGQGFLVVRDPVRPPAGVPGAEHPAETARALEVAHGIA